MDPKQLEQFRRLEEEIQAREADVTGAKEELRFAKEGLEKALLNLREYVRALVNPTPLPLLDGVDTRTGEMP